MIAGACNQMMPLHPSLATSIVFAGHHHKQPHLIRGNTLVGSKGGKYGIWSRKAEVTASIIATSLHKDTDWWLARRMKYVRVPRVSWVRRQKVHSQFVRDWHPSHFPPTFPPRRESEHRATMMQRWGRVSWNKTTMEYKTANATNNWLSAKKEAHLYPTMTFGANFVTMYRREALRQTRAAATRGRAGAKPSVADAAKRGVATTASSKPAKPRRARDVYGLDVSCCQLHTEWLWQEPPWFAFLYNGGNAFSNEAFVFVLSTIPGRLGSVVFGSLETRSRVCLNHMYRPPMYARFKNNEQLQQQQLFPF